MGAPGDLIQHVEFTGAGSRQANADGGIRGGVIESVESGSAAWAAGIRSGDVLLRVNGRRIRDVIDYQFYAADAVLNLDLQRPEVHADGYTKWRAFTSNIVRDPGESLGISFTQPTFAPIRECNNHCPFCFIDQLPASMRSSLYIRDDDYRYSFLFGNFVTLTNLNERDWGRLAEQRLSPLYISVHATDPETRRLLLGNERAPDIRDQLRRLFDIGISVHTQIVVCPGLNDGTVLAQTVGDLARYHRHVLSIGVVPVGLTRTPAEILSGPGASCSRILPNAAELGLRTFEISEARSLLAQVHAWQREYRQLHNKSLIHASDELYLLAGVPVPRSRVYDGYPQYENGIGMVRDLLDDWARARRRIKISRAKPHPLAANPRIKRVTAVCGEMIAPILRPRVDEWAMLRGISAETVAIENAFFGPRVRVSGLLTARDILANSKRFAGDVIVLPEVMLDKTGSRLLDNVTPAELSAALDRPIAFAGLMSGLDAGMRDPSHVPD